MNYPLVLIHCIDHSSNDSGDAGPYSMLICGILVKQDEYGYYIKHMVFDHNPNDDANVSSFVAHTAKLSIVELGHVKMKGV